MKTAKKTYHSVEEIKKKMARYCAYRDRSVYETEKKLDEYRLIPGAKDHILAFLLEENFLNDERFARSYARGKFYQNHWGKRKIIQGLQQHRLTSYYIEKAFEEIHPADYRNTIRKLIRKKINEYKTGNRFQLKTKLYRYLTNKGYAPNEFLEILENEINPDSHTSA